MRPSTTAMWTCTCAGRLRWLMPYWVTSGSRALSPIPSTTRSSRPAYRRLRRRWHDPALHRQGDGGDRGSPGHWPAGGGTAAAEGARLVLVDIADYVQGVAAELRDQGVEALAVQANLETWEGAEMVMARAHEQYGRIDIL